MVPIPAGNVYGDCAELRGEWYSLVDSLRTSLLQGGQNPENDMDDLAGPVGFENSVGFR